MGRNFRYLTADRTSAGDEVYTPFYAVEPLLEFLPKDKKIWCPFDEEWSAFYQLLSEQGYEVERSSLNEGKDFFRYEPEKWDIESAVKGERAVEYVNPDFFKSLPKQERFTQRMDEGQARKKSAELTAKGVEHSAVFGGEKSAVTVAKKDSQRAFFSRGRMQRDAQRISGRGQQKSQQREQTPKKRKNQGLE